MRDKQLQAVRWDLLRHSDLNYFNRPVRTRMPGGVGGARSLFGRPLSRYCNPSFSIYTELALSASDRLIIPFSADGSSKRAVRAVLALIYGITRSAGSQQSQFYLNSQQFRLPIPKIYCYAGNRLTQYISSATAFRTVVHEIGNEIWSVWQTNPNVFHIHPTGSGSPSGRSAFNRMFQFEIVDANTASVVSSSLGIPIVRLTSGTHDVSGRRIKVNQSQLDNQQPNIQQLVAAIE